MRCWILHVILAQLNSIYELKKLVLDFSFLNSVQSLCNACGIRQRKARRAMAAAAAAAAVADSGALPLATMLSPKSKLKQHKNKRSSRATGCGQEPIKKKCKARPHNNHASTGGKKLCLEEFAIRLSKHLAFQRVFPQEEKEAAILLMALSYGLVHGWWRRRRSVCKKETKFFLQKWIRS